MTDSRVRTAIVGVRCTPDEHADIGRAAAARGLSTSAYLRDLHARAAGVRLRTLDELTAAVENVCEVAAIEVEVHELDITSRGWVRNGTKSPLSRLVRCLRSSGLLDETTGWGAS